MESVSEVQLTRIVRGEAPMSMAHAADLTRTFGLILMGGMTLRRVVRDTKRLRAENQRLQEEAG